MSKKKKAMSKQEWIEHQATIKLVNKTVRQTTTQLYRAGQISSIIKSN